jgi:branched-chain amino acid transport system ATP-binding protein
MVEKIFEVVREISKEGLTVLLVEQNARLAFDLCERAYVLEVGRLALEGPSAELRERPEVRAAYLGAA